MENIKELILRSALIDLINAGAEKHELLAALNEYKKAVCDEKDRIIIELAHKPEKQKF